MLIHLIGLVAFCYTAVRLIPSLPFRGSVKLAVAALMLAASQYHFISRHVLGSLASPELPTAVLAAQGWLFFSMALLFVMCVGRDAALVVFWLARQAGAKASLPGSKPLQAALMLVLALSFSAYGVWQAVRIPAPRSLEITLPRLPAELDGFTLAHITDPHASALLRGPRMRSIVDTVMAMKPDMILMSGDLVDGTVDARREDVAAMGEMAAPHGVYSCPGNHEYFAEYAAWMEHFAALGITMLRNSHVVADVKGVPLVIAGTTDPVSSRFGLPGPDADAALAGSPDQAVRILLEHRPGSARENAAKGVDLQLSGHTHGGHIVGFDRVVAQFNNGFVSGLYDLGPMRLYVSNGAGLWNGFPIRLGVPSEVTRIVLRQAG